MAEESRKRRVGLYGGTFDPVHNGHLAVARNLSRLFALDEVLFVPAHVAPHKRGAAVSPPLQRHAMLALATQDAPRFRVSTAELDAPERPYSVETVERFRDELGPTARLFFVMGADSWAEIKTWREWQRLLLETVDHVVVTRPGYELGADHVTEAVRGRIVDARGAGAGRVAQALGEAKGETRIYLSDAVTVDLSATEVRRAARAGAPLGDMVPRPVADYVRKYRLYEDDE